MTKAKRSLISITTLAILYLPQRISAFHDCIEPAAEIRRRRKQSLHPPQRSSAQSSSSPESCSGGLCVGMANGPHEGGNAAYPISWNGKSATSIKANMKVPGLPKASDDITYYIWTDVFFGDTSLGRMNQFVPQLMYGNVLDESTGPPNYQPRFHNHNDTWVFGAHYYFQTFDTFSNSTKSHAAYGPIFPTWKGETLYTTFELLLPQNDSISSPQWILTMGVLGDRTRVSELTVPYPYMGIGRQWDEPTTSWLENSYKYMCINACWELYGAKNSAHLPTTGSTYEISIHQTEANSFPFLDKWERDEGNGKCPFCLVQEQHTDQEQFITIEIDVASPGKNNDNQESTE
jgi:hypothetical protein